MLGLAVVLQSESGTDQMLLNYGEESAQYCYDQRLFISYFTIITDCFLD